MTATKYLDRDDRRLVRIALRGRAVEIRPLLAQEPQAKGLDLLRRSPGLLLCGFYTGFRV